jgi:hypothetical protein
MRSDAFLWTTTAEERPARKERVSSSFTSATSAGQSQIDIDEAETLRHRDAIRDYKDQCQGVPGVHPWVSAEALLYICDGDMIVERYALWLFPRETERYLSATAPDGTVKEFYIVVRLEGQNKLSRISLGVCQTSADTFVTASSARGAPIDVDPTIGHILRIVSIEKDGDPLLDPEFASPFLHNAKHIREVIRKHSAKCTTISSNETVHRKFGVLRTTAFLNAKETMQRDDCDADTWRTSMKALKDRQSFPWHLTNRVASLGAMHVLQQAESLLGTTGKVHIVDDIWLVHEQLPLSSNDFVVSARWAIQKSIRGTGSIPRAKMWEPVVVVNRNEGREFKLMRMA